MNKLAAKNVMKRLYELALSGASEQYLAGACEIAVMAGMAKTTVRKLLDKAAEDAAQAE